jgi:hypothetical protein
MINEKTDAEQPVNLYWPMTGFRSSLDPNEVKSLGFLTKIKPSETFGANAGLTEVNKLAFSIKYKQDVEKMACMGKTSKDTEVQGSINVGESTAPEQTPGTHEMGTGPDEGIEGYNPTNFGDSAGEINCPVCTMLNPISFTKCEVCDSNLH